MKKIFRYITNTIKCHFDNQFHIKKTKIKWITYNIHRSNNIKTHDSIIYHSSFYCKGKNNSIEICNKSHLSYSNISISGYNNKVVLDGCYCGLNLIVNGNNCIVYIGENTVIESCYMVCMGYGNSINIGKDGMFAGDVEIWNTDSHLITDLDGNYLNNGTTPVNIGNHVWLGKHSRILKGVTISDNSIVGMNSVVTKDIPNNSIAAGNPAKIIKSNILWRKGFITQWQYAKKTQQERDDISAK